MRILMLTPYLPYPPSSGGQIRSFNLIKQLSKKHQIILYSLIKREEEKKYIPDLEKICERVEVFTRPSKPWTIGNIIRTGLSFYPFLVVRNYSADEKQSLAENLAKENYDIIHAETFYVSPHIAPTSVPIVLVDQTIEYQVYQHFVENFKWAFLKPLLSIDVLKIKYWETHYWKKASRVVAVSDRDAQLMQRLVPGLKVTVVPNGVGEDLIEDIPLHFSNQLLFIGNYAWLQNIEAAKILANEVFPRVLKQVPKAELVIAGQNTDRIGELKSDRVRLVNLEIEDIEGVKKCYRESGVLVAPLYGPGGTRLKILGAMASKLPVVTTSIGIAGLDAVTGESFMCGDTSEELAHLTIKLLQDKDLYKKLASNARKLVDEKYSYQASAKKLDELYEEVSHGKVNN